MRRLLEAGALALSVGLCACGGGPGLFTGTVAGKSLLVKDAVFVAGSEVWLTSAEGLCAKLQANTLPKNESLLKIQLRPVATGSFTVEASSSTGKANTAFFQLLTLDGACNNTLAFGPSIGTQGSLTVEHLEAAKQISGKFDLTFGGQDHVTGVFNAGYCDAPITYPAPRCE